MNWKNVLYLLRVERKSGRLIRGIKATRYRENGFLAYWPYWVALIIGVLGGLIANCDCIFRLFRPSHCQLALVNKRSAKRLCFVAYSYVGFQLCIYSTAANSACRNQSRRASYVLAAGNVAGTNVSVNPV